MKRVRKGKRNDEGSETGAKHPISKVVAKCCVSLPLSRSNYRHISKNTAPVYLFCLGILLIAIRRLA
jgi:hypothetical protein